MNGTSSGNKVFDLRNEVNLIRVIRVGPAPMAGVFIRKGLGSLGTETQEAQRRPCEDRGGECGDSSTATERQARQEPPAAGRGKEASFPRRGLTSSLTSDFWTL